MCFQFFFAEMLAKTRQTWHRQEDCSKSCDQLWQMNANRHLLAVPRFPLNTYGRRASFSVAGPMAWNSLPDFIRVIQRAAQTVLGVYLFARY